jgi:hypothetical protein
VYIANRLCKVIHVNLGGSVDVNFALTKLAAIAGFEEWRLGCYAVWLL